MFDFETTAEAQERIKLEAGLAEAPVTLSVAENLIDMIPNLPVNAEGQQMLELGLETLAPLVGFESIEEFGEIDIYTYEYSAESLKDLPRKIYRAVADFITNLIKRLRALFGFSDSRTEKAMQETEARLSDFEKRAKQSEETISTFNLEPGAKPDKETLEKLETANAFYFSDVQGRVLTKEMYESDMTQLIPANYRKDYATLSQLVLNGKIDDLVQNLSDVSRLVTEVINRQRPAYDRFVERLMNVRRQEDIDWLVLEGFKAVSEEDADFVKELGFQRGKGVKSRKPILGERYPSLLPERSGKLQMHSMIYSSQRGRVVTTEAQVRLPKKLPKISMGELEKIRQMIAQLETKKKTLSEALESGMRALEVHSSGNGDNLKAAADKLSEFHNERNAQEIESLRALIRNIGKHHSIAYSHHKQTYAYIDRLLMSLNAFAVMMLGKD